LKNYGTERANCQKLIVQSGKEITVINNVPEKEKNELFTIIESTKPDIVMSSTTSKQ